ncbi:hypothetical protein, conserved [Eimeria tenella]|uniref:Uncharacterized protein n=1 Tax=Eimeria tenella TaxID=5802 RepID=U6KWW6_EIMTE|nr:hypothetical protein, conserved [Eimeria tenella]CDJ42642.1 hypothetical protein, conserved [Eimeria tenella]|eukprot:XP_013233392.1 hypothetical protein, conserved [Eimeria tenella]
MSDSVCACRIVEEKPEVTEEFTVSPAAAPPVAAAVSGSRPAFRQVYTPWVPVFRPMFTQQQLQQQQLQQMQLQQLQQMQLQQQQQQQGNNSFQQQLLQQQQQCTTSG